jgi:hypothetical protein
MSNAAARRMDVRIHNTPGSRSERAHVDAAISLQGVVFGTQT